MSQRSLHRAIPSIPTSDGAGVKLRRSLGSSQTLRHDPFLMLDEFYSDDPNDYLAGFPSHPHRGFETVTYMLDGRMQHKDSGGNTGDLGPGDVQWMSAARGIVHSEMPQQSEGRMRGFQLWLNLPAKEKMKPAAYRDISAKEIPVVSLSNGVSVKVVAGSFQETTGPIHGLSTDPYFFDAILPPKASVDLPLPAGHNAFLYQYEGSSFVGEKKEPLANSTAALLGDGESIRIEAGEEGARVLALAGRPIREPIVQYGPFVMNTREKIEQAIRDYQSGALASKQVERLKIFTPA